MVFIIKIYGVPQLTPDHRLEAIEREIIDRIPSIEGLSADNLKSSRIAVHFMADLRMAPVTPKITAEISGWIMEEHTYRGYRDWDKVFSSLVGEILAQNFPESQVLCLPAFDKWNSTREVWDSAESGLWIRREDLKPGLLLRGCFEEPYEFASLSDDGDCQIYFLNGDRSRKDNKTYGWPVSIEDGVVHFGEGVTRLDRSPGLSWR